MAIRRAGGRNEEGAETALPPGHSTRATR
jgi:hypothetical protein